MVHKIGVSVHLTTLDPRHYVSPKSLDVETQRKYLVNRYSGRGEGKHTEGMQFCIQKRPAMRIAGLSGHVDTSLVRVLEKYLFGYVDMI